MTTSPKKTRRCCSDHKQVCSKSGQLFLDAVERAGNAPEAIEEKPRKCWRPAMAEEVRPEPRPADPSEVVLLRSRRSRQKNDLTSTCNCRISGVSEILRDFHDPRCLITLEWVVRVPFETEGGTKASGDSIRMCRADAVRFAGDYRQHKPKIVRVRPLYR